MMSTKHLHRYLAGIVCLPIKCKQGGSKLTAYSDGDGGSSPDNGELMSPHDFVFLSMGVCHNLPIS